jgi:uroporphyrinogen decarboxylase
MDIYEIRCKYPKLILVGGVDVTNLLRTGSCYEVRMETRKVIQKVGAEGRLMIGSSTEVGNDVPLDNYLAFHHEVMREQ